MSSLPPRPSLEWLRKTAKERLVELRRTAPEARLADAQRLLAREHGFSSWRRLKAHVDAQAVDHGDAAAPEAIDEPLVDAFLEAVGVGRIDEVRAMLTATPALVRAVGPHPFWGGRPQALHVAIEGRRRDLFDLLLERGADVDGVNDGYDHWSPLMLAIQRDDPGMREALLDRGARVGLLEALMLGDDTRVGALLASGERPTITPNGGSILAFARTPFALDRLLELGAPVELRDRWGSAPIDALSRLGRRGEALVRHLVERGVEAAPKEYARMNDRATLEARIAADPSIARSDAVLLAAVDFGHRELVAWLLDRGADVNARVEGPSRQTALHSAAWNGDLGMVRLLVDRGADVTLRDAHYQGTPAGWAATAVEVTNNPRCAEVAAFLAARDSG
ncbi:MAG: ankyrin repeat domain-containing protein [Nannocystaceae bacterium]